MSAQRYRMGQTISYLLRIGATAEKRVVGEIVEVGSRGYRVKVEGHQNGFWLRAGQIRPVGSTAPTEIFDAPAEPAAAPEEPARTETTAPSSPDPIEAWLAQGRELLSTADALVAREELAVAHADREVGEARALLTATEATATGARNRLRLALERRADVARRTGGA